MAEPSAAPFFLCSFPSDQIDGVYQMGAGAVVPVKKLRPAVCALRLSNAAAVPFFHWQCRGICLSGPGLVSQGRGVKMQIAGNGSVIVVDVFHGFPVGSASLGVLRGFIRHLITSHKASCYVNVARITPRRCSSAALLHCSAGVPEDSARDLA